MNNNKYKRAAIPVLLILIFCVSVANSQVNVNVMNQPQDSLALKNIISSVITGHPSVKAAQEAINNANSRIELARTGYYPDVDITGSFANIGPVTKLTIPNMGSFQLYPQNNYSASLNYRQVIYDFGRTRENIEIETETKALNEQTLEQVKQRLSLLTVNNFYTLVFLQAAIKIKDEQIAALNSHLQYVEKMQATGSATEYQILATKVKISTIESQKLDLQAALSTQQAMLNSLLGKSQSEKPVVKNELAINVQVIPYDSVLSYAYRNRDEVLLNEKRASLAGLRYDMIKLQNRPVFSFQAAGGAKNGYVPELNKFTPNYVVGVGVRIPLFDAMRTKYNLQQAQSAITSLSYESEYTKRNISSEITEAEAYMSAAFKKIAQFELQQQQALKAYSLADVSFRSGVLTNLDLLDANTAVSESSLLLLKAKIDYAASIIKFKAALGERIY